MVIQHNASALSALNQITLRGGQIAKDLQKIASGYRINIAADDSAGLAISQRMRAHVIGIEQARKNVEAGSDLVDIGDGGMTEIHAMLQRMSELSVQAANGTYTYDERVKMDSEVGALREEIDRIAECTNYNGIFMLKGDRSYTDEISGASGGGRGPEGAFQIELPIYEDLPYGKTIQNIFGKGIELEYEVVDGKIVIKGGSDGVDLGKVSENIAAPADFNNVYGGSGDDTFSSVIRTEDGGYLVVGTTQSNDGDVPDEAYDVARDGHYTASNTLKPIEDVTTIPGYNPDHMNEGGDPWTSNYSPKQLVMKLDKDGNVEWSTALGDSAGKGYGRRAVVLPNGNYAILGNVNNPWGMQMHTSVTVLDQNGVLISNQLYHPNGVGSMNSTISSDLVAVDDGFIVVGGVRNTVDGNYKPVLTKFDLNGNVVSTNLMDHLDGHHSMYSIKRLENGNLVMAGSSSGTDLAQGGTTPHGSVDIWIATFDSNMNMLTSQVYGSQGRDSGYYVHVMPDGGYIVTGDVAQGNGDPTEFASANGGTDAFVMRFDKNNNLMWRKAYGGAGDEAGQCLQLDNEGNIILTANTTSNNTGDVGQSLGGQDGWIVKIDAATGDIIDKENFGSDGDDTLKYMAMGSDGSFMIGGDAKKVGGDVGDHFEDGPEKDVIHGNKDIWLAAFTGFKDKVIELPLKDIVYERDADGNAKTVIVFDKCTSVLTGDGKTLKSLVLTAHLENVEGAEAEDYERWEDMDPIIIQCGPKEGDIFIIKRADMRTPRLFHQKELSLLSIQDANLCNAIVKNAIGIVSLERAKFGSYFNALQRIESNLTASSENLTSAESRIRDTDMAKQMMSLMKNDIIVQSAQSMLVQANQTPQNVLQLLK